MPQNRPCATVAACRAFSRRLDRRRSVRPRVPSFSTCAFPGGTEAWSPCSSSFASRAACWTCSIPKWRASRHQGVICHTFDRASGVVRCLLSAPFLVEAAGVARVALGSRRRRPGSGDLLVLAPATLGTSRLSLLVRQPQLPNSGEHAAQHVGALLERIGLSDRTPPTQRVQRALPFARPRDSVGAAQECTAAPRGALVGGQ